MWSATSFYAIRILLGAAEAGFFPGLLFYCTLWFPRAYRARIFGLTQIAPPLSSVVGAPLSTWLLTSMDGVAGLKGWQWMFVIEGIPALVMGVVLVLLLPSRPEDARFLSADEKAVLTGLMSRERAERERVNGSACGRP